MNTTQTVPSYPPLTPAQKDTIRAAFAGLGTVTPAPSDDFAALDEVLRHE